MADHILPTTIQLRYDTYENWMNSSRILKTGEIAIATFSRARTINYMSNSLPDNTPPAVGIKVGDGYKYFFQLPWLQGIAADVYQWAKTPTKPTYSATEINGLQDYINTYGPQIPGDGTIAPRLYQIVQGTGANADKYYLQSRASATTGDWVVDTSRYIDLSKLSQLLNWVRESNISGYPSLTTLTGYQTYSILDTLDYADTAIENQFVTSVSENNGLITVSRARPTFENIAGIVPVTQGGTGLATLAAGQVLIGNGENGILSREIATEIAANNFLVPNYLVKAYVDASVAGLTGAMHFVGDATVEITGANNPQIEGYNFAQAKPGDVILSGFKEYVWTGGRWRLFGDEGSYAVKGSIRDADIDPEANIQQSKIYNLRESFAEKVDKVEGKQLSTNDYTNEDRYKLSNIEDRAQVNVIEHILLNGTEVAPRTVEGVTKTVPLVVSEFDPASRAKLEGIQPEAQVNAIETILVNGIAQPLDVEHKSIDLAINEYPTADAEKLATIETGAEVNTIERITVDGELIEPDANRTVAIVTDPHTEHINKIESISVNGTLVRPDENKHVAITIDTSMNAIEGATVPNGNSTQDVTVINRKLMLARIAATGNVADLLQTPDTYVLIDCGTSTDVI